MLVLSAPRVLVDVPWSPACSVDVLHRAARDIRSAYCRWAEDLKWSG